MTIFTTALAGGVVSAAAGSAVGRLNGGAKAVVEPLGCLGYHDVSELLGVLVVQVSVLKNALSGRFDAWDDF